MAILKAPYSQNTLPIKTGPLAQPSVCVPTWCNLAANDNNKFDFNIKMLELTIKQLELLLDQYISYYDQTVDIENRIAKMIH
jgi:hypothetical protein